MTATLMLLSNPYRPDPRVLGEVRALTGSGFDVELIAWDREGIGPPRTKEGRLETIRLGPLCPQRAPAKILARLPRFWLRTLLAAKALNFNVVHAHDFDTLPLGYTVSRLSGKPLIYDAHELYAKMVRDEVGPLSRLIWLFERSFSKRAEVVITVSDALADELSVGRKERALVVSTTQDPSALEGVEVPKIREKYGMKGFVVSYLGSLEPGRFVEESISSFGPQDGVTMLVAGTGTLRPRVEQMALGNPAVKYIGVVDTDEALRITCASDLVVAMMDPKNPNNVVGTPGKIINAMACGRPVVTNLGLRIAERIAAERAGLVVPYEKEAFRKAVLEASKNPKTLADYGRNGRAFYEREFSWEKSKSELLKAYRALIGPT